MAQDRTERIPFYVTKAEKEAIREKAEAQGMTIAAYIRMVLLYSEKG